MIGRLEVFLYEGKVEKHSDNYPWLEKIRVDVTTLVVKSSDYQKTHLVFSNNGSSPTLE